MLLVSGRVVWNCVVLQGAVDHPRGKGVVPEDEFSQPAEDIAAAQTGAAGSRHSPQQGPRRYKVGLPGGTMMQATVMEGTVGSRVGIRGVTRLE